MVKHLGPCTNVGSLMHKGGGNGLKGAGKQMQQNNASLTIKNKAVLQYPSRHRDGYKHSLNVI